MNANKNIFESIKRTYDQNGSKSFDEINQMMKVGFSKDLSNCPLFKFTFDETKNIGIIEVRENDLFVFSEFGDEINCMLLETFFDAILTSGVNTVIFSFKNIECFADLSLAILSTYIEKFRETQRSLILSDLSEQIENIFKLMEYDKIVNIEKSIEDALLRC